MLLCSLSVRIGAVISRRAQNSTLCFCKLPFFSVLPNRCAEGSVPVLLTGRLICSGFGWAEDWVELEREELEWLLAADGVRPTNP